MSIGFQFTASVKQKSAVLETIKRLSEQFGCQFFSGEDWARVAFCRMGDLQFTFAEKKSGLFAKTELTGTACTSTAGAGFHASAIDFTDALVSSEHLKIQMEDETGYYTHRDFERMRREHFYSWLKMLAEQCAHGNWMDGSICLCWDAEQYLPESAAGSFATPFGRFHIQETLELIEHKGIEVFADVFFLWNEREKNARFYRNCALSILWEDCYFEPGSRSETDHAINQSAIDLLEQAVVMDPSLPIPKAEYALLCALQQHAPIDVSASPDRRNRYLIGYRRGNVSCRIGNTSLTMPGCFLAEPEDNVTLWFDGHAEHWRNLRVSAFGVREGNAEFTPALFEKTAEPAEEFDVGDGKGLATFAGEIQEDDGTVYYQSVAQIICQRQITLVTACYQHPEEKAWAMALFRQIRAYKDEE